MSNRDIQTIVEACKEGDQKAFRILYDRYSKKLLAVAVRYVSSVESAKDVLQLVFLRIYKSIPKFTMINEPSLEGWMRRITINESLRWVQKNARYNYDDIEGKQINISVKDADPYVVDDILKIVSQLPLGYRLVFNLSVVEGYSHKEISQKLGISEGTSRSQLLRGRQAIREALLKLENFERVK